MVSFNFVYWQWRVMSNKQQFSMESRAQFNKPISFLTYILQAPEDEGSWTYISTGEDSDFKCVNEKSTTRYLNQIAAPEYVNRIPTPEYINAWVDCS